MRTHRVQVSKSDFCSLQTKERLSELEAWRRTPLPAAAIGLEGEVLGPRLEHRFVGKADPGALRS